MAISRRLVLASLALGVLALVRAQGMCREDGPTLDELVAQWNAPGTKPAVDSQAFSIMVQRKERAQVSGRKSDGSAATGEAVIGELLLNQESLGRSVENVSTLVPAGQYRGRMRYWSDARHAQGLFGKMGDEGDFLLELVGVSGRTNILIHGGTKPWHSKG